ncbi:MAG: phosphorylase [Nodosilinea sp.]
MVNPSPSWDAADLRSMIHQRSRHALDCGALQPIQTRYEFVAQGGMEFVVRVVANLARKEQSDHNQERQRQAGQEVNPFLPYDPDLFVTDLSGTHLCLLNKYNVVEDHILIVTRAFEEQDSWLTGADLAALADCLGGIDGLGFFNGGRRAGASQRHKHLQVIPPPLGPEGGPLPLAQVIADLEMGGAAPGVTPPEAGPGYYRSPLFDFHHSILPLPAGWWTDPAAGSQLEQHYRHLLTHLGADLSAPPQSFAYNLLVTRQWMVGIRRRQDRYQSIPVNSLGFAGSLLVKNEDQLTLVKQLGPMTILHQVADQS